MNIMYNYALSYSLFPPQVPPASLSMDTLYPGVKGTDVCLSQEIEGTQQGPAS